MTQCNNDVNVLYNRALASCDKNIHDKCEKNKKASFIPGCEINIFFQLLGSEYVQKVERE